MSKFGNKKTLVDGVWFDSKKEANRYVELKMLQAAKLIRNLMMQQVFELAPSVVIQGRKRPLCCFGTPIIEEYPYKDDA